MLRHAVDRLLTKLVSRKLMVWLTATGLMLTETVPLRSEDWVAISLAYIGIQYTACREESVSFISADMATDDRTDEEATGLGDTAQGVAVEYPDPSDTPQGVVVEDYAIDEFGLGHHMLQLPATSGRGRGCSDKGRARYGGRKVSAKPWASLFEDKPPA